MTQQSTLKFTKRAAPTLPAAGQLLIYTDANGDVQILDENGTSTPINQTTLARVTDAGTMASQNASSAAITGGSLKATTGLGYNTGAGGTVTQSTSKSTSVTLNTYSGTITMASSQLNANTSVTFTFNNSVLEANDQLVVTHHSGGTAGSYTVVGRVTGAGTGSVTLRNVTAGNLTETPVLKFSVIKGAVA